MSTFRPNTSKTNRTMHSRDASASVWHGLQRQRMNSKAARQQKWNGLFTPKAVDDHLVNEASNSAEQDLLKLVKFQKEASDAAVVVVHLFSTSQSPMPPVISCQVA
jgi:hypothetical protein